MLEWYEPDIRSAFVGNFKSKEAFAEKQVVRGHFHASVPEDIVKSYKTVEYLMAHAWYHWPMFDEALRKLLGILEMAVKFRCLSLGIAVKFESIDDDGKKTLEDKSLSSLIDQLSKAERTKGLKKRLHDIRQLRNYYAHPADHNFMGGMAIGKIRNLVNLINLIFLDKEVFKASKSKAAGFKKEIGNFKKGLFVLECNQSKILVTEMGCLEAFQIQDDWVYLCFFSPVLAHAFDTMSEHTYPPPPIFALKQVALNEGVLVGIDFETDSSMKIFPTVDPDNQKALNKHLQELEQVDSTDQTFYKLHLDSACGRKQRDFMYQNRWIS